jgi:uncharacterized membrane protein YvbJ
MNNQYVPGVCNIGKEEIKRRKVAAFISLAITVILIMILLLWPANRYWRLILFFPVTSLAVGIQQWYFHFCVAFGIKGVFNFADFGKTDSVEQANFRKKDLSKARRMIIAGIAVGIIADLIFYYFPF